MDPGLRSGAPDEAALPDPQIKASLSLLPANYNFEVEKIIGNLRKFNSKGVALQFPEGLLRYSLLIASIIERHCPGCEAVVLGDVTYGACCIDDFTARAVGADFLVHFGHSCLVPIDKLSSGIRFLYVFVEISFDPQHLTRLLRETFPCKESEVFLLGTIQFFSTISALKRELQEGGWTGVSVPQERPLSPGEVLGCTAPRLPQSKGGERALVFVADGRFHLEAVMIANPSVPAYRYDPYTKRMTREYYDHDAMLLQRKRAISSASDCQRVGLILGTLGRQSSRPVYAQLEKRLRERFPSVLCVCLSEVTPRKLAMFPQIQAWVQTSCPRLSLDWSGSFATPLLSPYEASVLTGSARWQEVYPMDFYSTKSSLGPWTPNYAFPAPAAAGVGSPSNAKLID